jgi:signal transduction histidine kinase
MLHFKQTVFLLLFLAFCACQNQKDTNQTLFPKPPAEKLDSVGTWLEQDSNYLTDQYLPFFQKHFNQQIALNNIDSAARLLDIAGRTANNNFEFDTVLIQTHLDFLAKYETQIPNRFRSDMYNNLGEFYSIVEELSDRDYDKSISFYKKNDFVPKDYYEALNEADANNGIMDCFTGKSEYDSAIVYGLKALDFYEKYKDWRGQANVYKNLTWCYQSIEEDFMAEKYINLAIEVAKKSKDNGQIHNAIVLKTILLYNTESSFFPSSVDSLEQFEAQWKSKDPKYHFLTQTFKAMKCVKEKKIKEAGKILETLKPLYPTIEDDWYNEWYPDALSDYEIAIQKPLSMEQYYLQELKMLESKKEFDDIHTNYEILSEGAVIKKDYKAALTYHKKSVAARDSARNNKIQYQARELEKKYQTEKKEVQLQLQAEEALIKNVFIAFLVLGLLAFVYFYSLLKKKNTTISQQNELNEQTIAILSHDIKEPLLGVKLLLKKLNKDDPFVAQASQSLENQITSVNGILTNLLRMKKASLVKKDKNATANANAVVQNVVRELSVAIQTKALTINNELTDELTLPIAPEKLQIIIHNLLSNAVKYSFPNQQIRIFKEGKGICIQDFGVGLSPEQRSKLMREVTASQHGTNQERGNGLGLFLIGAMLQGEQLKVVFDSPEVGGTIAKVLG